MKVIRRAVKLLNQVWFKQGVFFATGTVGSGAMFIQFKMEKSSLFIRVWIIMHIKFCGEMCCFSVFRKEVSGR